MLLRHRETPVGKGMSSLKVRSWIMMQVARKVALLGTMRSLTWRLMWGRTALASSSMAVTSMSQTKGLEDSVSTRTTLGTIAHMTRPRSAPSLIRNERLARVVYSRFCYVCCLVLRLFIRSCFDPVAFGCVCCTLHLHSYVVARLRGGGALAEYDGCALLLVQGCAFEGSTIDPGVFLLVLYCAVERGLMPHYANCVVHGIQYGFDLGLSDGAVTGTGRCVFYTYPVVQPLAAVGFVGAATQSRIIGGGKGPTPHQLEVFQLVSDHTKTGPSACTDTSAFIHSLTAHRDVSELLGCVYFMSVCDVTDALSITFIRAGLGRSLLYQWQRPDDAAFRCFVRLFKVFGTHGLPGVFCVLVADVVTQVARSELAPAVRCVEDVAVIHEDPDRLQDSDIGLMALVLFFTYPLTRCLYPKSWAWRRAFDASVCGWDYDFKLASRAAALLRGLWCVLCLRVPWPLLRYVLCPLRALRLMWAVVCLGGWSPASMGRRSPDIVSQAVALRSRAALSALGHPSEEFEARAASELGALGRRVWLDDAHACCHSRSLSVVVRPSHLFCSLSYMLLLLYMFLFTVLCLLLLSLCPLLIPSGCPSPVRTPTRWVWLVCRSMSLFIPTGDSLSCLYTYEVCLVSPTAIDATGHGHHVLGDRSQPCV